MKISERLLQALAQAEEHKLHQELTALRNTANHARQRKHGVVTALANEGHQCWGELRPYDLLLAVMQHMTVEELRTIIQRAAPPAVEHPPREPKTNEDLARDVMLTLRRASRAGIWRGHKQ